jgi:hypothetical protein
LAILYQKLKGEKRANSMFAGVDESIKDSLKYAHVVHLTGVA